eukprot:TRINITY_DN5086_c0_g1_i1.p1 TRINITY_DN5086_c0_g1~~TRINITY_DN5086_c0_g1_i1.p1  ORF type:complete len:531 (-),score=80.00 TRINITY_DN5086_c0_g1_i1:14-1606(-)
MALRSLISERDEEVPNSIEILKDRIYFVSLRIQPRTISNAHFFTVDNELVYESFFADFGPLNLGHVYSFCKALDRKLSDVRFQKKRIFLYTSFDACKRTNAAFLICAYSVIRLGRSPEDAFRPFEGIYPAFLPFRDASVGLSTFNISILDCLRGLYKAIQNEFFNFDTFNLEEYQFYEKVENGDLNWIVPDKFIAFCGPTAVMSAEIRTFAPEDYLPLFKKHGVSTIVRLNKKEYDRTSFTSSGVRHYDLYFMDGSAPTESILRRFLEIAENESGVIAVHCKAGLGRTGTLIAAYIVKHYRFTAAEAIAWVRICRPGSVIGPQQHFLQELQARLWKQGEIMRKKRTLSQKLNTSNEDVSGVVSAVKSMTIAQPPAPISASGRAVYSPPSSSASGLYSYNLRQRSATSSASGSSGLSAYTKSIVKHTPIKRVKYPTGVSPVRSPVATQPTGSSPIVAPSPSSSSLASLSSVKSRQMTMSANSRVSSKRYTMSSVGNVSSLLGSVRPVSSHPASASSSSSYYSSSVSITGRK